MAENLPNLLSVILRMDPKDVAALASVHIIAASGGDRASFTFARWIQSASDHSGSGDWGRTEYEEKPDGAVLLDLREPIADQVQAVHESGRVGDLSTRRIRPTIADAGIRDEYFIKTHAGSDAERMTWLRSLRH